MAQLEGYDQIEPLPDIDFNIRVGNTLVGFTSLADVERAMTISATVEPVRLPGRRRPVAGQQFRALDEEQRRTLERIEEEAEIASWAFDQFREQQTTLGGEVTMGDKAALRTRLDSLSEELDRYLVAEYGVNPKKAAPYDAWRSSHQPFHWFVEFYGIMRKGGFDVVIGNPPYVEYSEVRKEYQVKGFLTERCGNLYALCTERSLNLLGTNRRFGFIVQAPIVSTQRMSPLRALIHECSSFNSYATYDDRPAKLFQGMDHCRVCIVLSCAAVSGGGPDVTTTRYHKWYTEEFPVLFQLVQYESVPIAAPSTVVPKLRSITELSIYHKILSQPRTLGSLISTTPTKHRIYYKITGVGHWFTFTTAPPRFWRDGVEGSSTRESSVSFSNPLLRDTAFCLLWSTLHYWLYQARTNCRDFNPSDLESVPIPKSIATGLPHFRSLAKQITNRLEETSDVGSATYSVGGAVRYQRFRPNSAKSIIDEIDRVLAEHYGFTDEELDFIINYDIKYRMGREG